MNRIHPKEGTQKWSALRALRKADGGYVSGRFFLHNLYLSQYHARIFELQADGWDIEPSDFVDEYGFKSYRLREDGQRSLPI